MPDPKTPDSKDSKKTEPKPLTLDEKLFSFQSSLVNLYRRKQTETDQKKRPKGNTLESTFSLKSFQDSNLVTKKIDNAAKIKDGTEGLDEKVKDELKASTAFDGQKAAYEAEKENIEAKINWQKKVTGTAYATQIERLIQTNDSQNFREVHANEWTKAAKGTTETKAAHEATLAQIDQSIQNLKDKKTAEDKAARDAKPGKTEDDYKKEEEIREKLLNNQIQKLNELKTDFEKAITKLPDDILEEIRNTKLTGEVTNPVDPASNISQGTPEEMNKALVKAQLLQLVGPGCVWASTDPKHDAEPLTLDNINTIKTGKFRVNDQNYRNESAWQGIQDVLIGLTGIGLLYLYFDRPTFLVKENGDVLWNTTDSWYHTERFSPDFFTAFQAKNPGSPMYLTFDATMSKEYFQQMVTESRTRRPILILELSDKWKEVLKKMPHSDNKEAASGKTKLQEFEDILRRDVDAPRGALGGARVGGEDSVLHARGPKK